MIGQDRVFDLVQSIAARVAGASRTPPQIGPDTRLANDFWLDSVEMLEVVLECEEEFGIVFEESRDLTPTALETIGGLADVIRSKLAKPPATK